MRGYLLVGHGKLPMAMQNSVQMISGENKDIYTVSLEPDNGKVEFANKIEKINEKLKKYDSLIVFSDLYGGSPNNGVIEKYFNNKKVEIITGMNLPMVLTAVLSDSSKEDIISEGISGIQDIKALKVSGKKEVRKKTNVDNAHSDDMEPFVIKNVRVDSRGIHGQVATAWVPNLGVKRIMVIDDVAVKDETQKMALKMAKPNSIKLSILSTKKAVEKLNDKDSYANESIMIIIQRIETLEALDRLGYKFEEINIGNVPNRSNTTSYRKTVYLTPEEVGTIKKLIEKGTNFVAQMVPNDTKVNFNEILNG